MSIVCGRRSSAETADEDAGGVWGYIYTRTATLGDMAWGGRSRPRCAAVGLGEGQGAACGMKGDEGVIGVSPGCRRRTGTSRMLRRSATFCTGVQSVVCDD